MVGYRWIVLGVGLLIGGCGGTTPPSATPTPEGGADRRALLAQVGEHVILAGYRAFTTDAQALSAATLAWQGAVATADASSRRADAQAAFATAMRTWERAELFQIGPAGAAGTVTGGLSLRDEIYSWPLVNPCRIDQTLATEAYTSPTFFEDSLVYSYGLDALEYLLFHTGVDNACPGNVAPNTNGAWAALTEAEIDRRRAAYAVAVAAHLAEDAHRLQAAWEPAEGNFLAQLTNAGASGSVYPSAQDALDEVFAALYYLELKTKDLKLAVPAGLSPDCASATCPDAVELARADLSTRAVEDNLKAFQAIFLGDAPGTDAPGFDDLLTAMGAEALAAEIGQKTAAAVGLSQAMGAPIEDVLTTDVAQVQALYDAVKAVTDLLKTQLVTTLNLTIPNEGAGDND